MAFNSSSTRYDSAGSSSGWSLDTGWWPGSSSVRSTLSSSGNEWSSETSIGGSITSLSSSSVPAIVTPSSSQLFPESGTASMPSSQVVSPESSQTSSSSSQIQSDLTSVSAVESSSTSKEVSSSKELTENQSSSMLSEPSNGITSSLAKTSASSTVSSSWLSVSSSSSSSSISTSSLSISSDSSLIDLSASSSSSENEISSTSYSSQYSAVYPSSTITTPTFTSLPSYTVSRDSRSVYYIYTQLYHITGSTTTFDTGLPTTTARAKTAETSFSVPTSTQTKGLQFYENWLNGDLGQSNGPDSPAKNKIIGGVVGGVGGAIVCAIIIWLMFFRRRKDKTKETRGFTSEIGRRTGYPLSSQSVEHDQEKAPLPAADNRQTPFLSRMKSKALAQISKNKIGTDHHPTTDSNNPFQDEFNFQARQQPPIPRPANTVSSQVFHSTTNQDVPIDHRFSYVSSLSDSSYISSGQGDYSTMSSTSIRLASDGGRDRSESSNGFLRELI